MTTERRIGIPGDIVYHDTIFANTEALPSSAYHVTELIKQLHQKGITGKGVVTAVLDTGESKHPFLNKPIASRDFTGSRTGAIDSNGHSSHCLGIIKSIAPDAEQIVGKVLGDSGSGSTTGINAGVVWSAKQGADIISMSLGDGGGPEIPSDLKSYDEAYSNGAKIVNAALGNAGFNGRTNTVGRPGSYIKHTHGIGALKRDHKTRADFSSGGPASRYYAPGDRIVSCRLHSGWVEMSGTSMATPCHTGYCALILSWLRGLGKPDPVGVAEWDELFKPYVMDLNTPGWDPATGHGIIDIPKFFQMMLDTTRI